MAILINPDCDYCGKTDSVEQTKEELCQQMVTVVETKSTAVLSKGQQF